jgi:hypothetical protein
VARLLGSHRVADLRKEIAPDRVVPALAQSHDQREHAVQRHGLDTAEHAGDAGEQFLVALLVVARTQHVRVRAVADRALLAAGRLTAHRVKRVTEHFVAVRGFFRRLLVVGEKQRVRDLARQISLQREPRHIEGRALPRFLGRGDATEHSVEGGHSDVVAELALTDHRARIDAAIPEPAAKGLELCLGEQTWCCGGRLSCGLRSGLGHESSRGLSRYRGLLLLTGV